MKSIEKRLPLDEDRLYIYCLHCGVKLQQIEKAKRKKFCCEACRHVWWREHKEYSKRKTTTRNCVFCGKEFEVNENSSKKYCSTDCYFKDRFKDNMPKSQRNDRGAISGGEKYTGLPDGCLCTSCAWFYDSKRHCSGCETASKNI